MSHSNESKSNLTIVYQPGDEMHDGTINLTGKPVEVEQTWSAVNPPPQEKEKVNE